MAGAGWSDAERLAALRLIRSDTVGPVTFRDLIDHFGSPTDAVAGVEDLASRGGRRIRVYPAEDAERECDALADIGGRFVGLGDPDYPRALAHTLDAPPLIAVRGDPQCLSRPIVSIVGSRNASVSGRKFAAKLAAGLGEEGFVVASGLARGIDSAAHSAAIATGTVAVFAGGLDRIYPPENVELAAAIVDAGGAQISEMPLGWVPRGRDFPRRNRIVSGIALGVVVVEAAERSGSLITARLAGEQGRVVFAIPGSPLDPRAAGSNRLIKNGAVVVTEVADIVDEVRPMLMQRGAARLNASEDRDDEDASPPVDMTDEDRATILSALGPSPIEVDEIVRFTGLPPAAVHLALLELSLAGRIERHGGQRVSLV